ncbi:MAG: HD domain-containing protein [Clostridia bacterium]
MNIEILKEYVKIKHKGQKRKQGTPYYLHPFAVADILKEKGFNEDYQAAGLLHDTLEDTNATKEEILKLSNKKVLDAVVLLTKEKGYKMQDYYNRIINSDMAKMVKLADRYHNLSESTMTNIFFKKKYLKETEEWYLKMAEGTCFEENIKQALDNLIKSL